MGWSGAALRVSVTLDSHAGEKEELEEKLWEEFCQEVKELADEKLNSLRYYDVDWGVA